MNTTERLRTNITKCLSDRKMSQIQLAVESNLHESVISRILSGKREINGSHLDKIGKALKLEIIDLLYYPEKVAVARISDEKITISLTAKNPAQ